MMFRGGVGDRRDQTKLKILLSKVFFLAVPLDFPAVIQHQKETPEQSLTPWGELLSIDNNNYLL